MINSIEHEQNDEKKYKINTNKKDKNNKTSKIFKKIYLDKTKINDIFETKGKTNISILSKVTNIETIYTYKSESKNNIFFQCSKRPKCKGGAKFDKTNLLFYITKECKDFELHHVLNKNKFNDLIANNALNNIDFKIKKIKSFLLNLY